MARAAPTAERPLRADAERNRERILEAARAAFAEQGLDVGLHEIAARAGVGVGTVYRRFPDKDVLIEALFQDRVDEVVAVAEGALAADDAWRGLRVFLEATCRLQASDRGLHQLVFAGDRGRRYAAGARARIAPLVAELVARAQAQGSLRADVGAADVGMLRNTLGLFIERMGDAAAETWPRLLTIALDGLCARRDEPSALPGAAPSPAMFERLLAADRRS